MTALYIVLGILAGLVLLYLLALHGRRNHPEYSSLNGWDYAHRGLHDEQMPENSMPAFRAALFQGYGIELDLHLMKDGELAVIHDSSLKRVCGVDVKIEDLTTKDLENYRLLGTDEKIPTFKEVLDLFDGRAPMIVELKTADGNYRNLCRKTCRMLSGYKGTYCIESFDPMCILWLRKNRPDIIRGQLSSDFRKEKNKKFKLRYAVMTNLLTNFLTKPDFVAYRFEHRKNLSCTLARKLWRVHGVSWTIRCQEDYDQAISEGWLAIFEKFIPNKKEETL